MVRSTLAVSTTMECVITSLALTSARRSVVDEYYIVDLEMDYLCSNLEIALVALRIPHALGINRNGVVAEL